jgi:hypothetical protein
VFDGRKEGTDTMGLEEYYAGLQKKKEEFLAGLKG